MKNKNVLIKLINFYQKYLSPDSGFLKKKGLIQKQICVFYPTCSEYTKEAIIKYGSFKGLKLGFFRVLRCHPWQKEHIDLLK